MHCKKPDPVSQAAQNKSLVAQNWQHFKIKCLILCMYRDAKIWKWDIVTLILLFTKQVKKIGMW